MASALTCYCDGFCPDDRQNGTCEIKSNGYCFSAVEEVWDEENGVYVIEQSFGCLTNEQGYLQCKSALVPRLLGFGMKCCNSGELCNKDIYPSFKPKNTASYNFIMKLFNNYVEVFWITLFILGLIFTSCVVLICFCCAKKLNCHTHNINIFVEEGTNSGSGLPRLIKSTIAKELMLSMCIGKGRYGEVWLANWHEQKVAVKIFRSLEEDSWVRETEIYQTPLLRHDNILGFIAADIKGTGSWTQMFLITDYHERGSLHDYLKLTVLDQKSLLTICLSLAAGLVHLHREILGINGKPAIAHRDIKSKNILIKRNGECAIADFGLSVSYVSQTGIIDTANNTRVGTRRYMAPEVLDESINASSFEAFKMADMYSVGLVLWEICRRYISTSTVYLAENYSLPYQNDVSNDPDFEEMRLIICVKGIRPTVPKKWKSDTILSVFSRLMTECWHSIPDVRPTALRFKKTIYKLKSNHSTVA